MPETPSDLRYHPEHTRIRLDGDEGAVGITDFAQEQLGEIVYVELPDPGSRLIQGQPFGVIESAKAVADLHAPVSGEVVVLNHSLDDAPETVNASPYADGWILRRRLADPAERSSLLDTAACNAGPGPWDPAS